VRDPDAPGYAPTVCAVVVTYNRKELLARCLDHLQRQSRAPERILVVDNASTDGTGGMLARRDGIAVHPLPENVGGAGGFKAGLEAAYRDGFEWIWLLDDDTFVDERCLETLLAGAERAPVEPVLMTSVVRWKDDSLHPMNRPWPRWNARADFARALAARLVPVRQASFVSTMVRRSAVARHRLPNAHYFSWHDDTEYTRRILAEANGYLAPDSTARHWTPQAYDVVSDDRGRFYFKVRNHIWMLRGDAYRGVEKVWGLNALLVAIRRYVGASRSTFTAAKTVARGVRDGLRREPR